MSPPGCYPDCSHGDLSFQQTTLSHQNPLAVQHPQWPSSPTSTTIHLDELWGGEGSHPIAGSGHLFLTCLCLNVSPGGITQGGVPNVKPTLRPCSRQPHMPLCSHGYVHHLPLVCISHHMWSMWPGPLHYPPHSLVLGEHRSDEGTSSLTKLRKEGN